MDGSRREHHTGVIHRLAIRERGERIRAHHIVGMRDVAEVLDPATTGAALEHEPGELAQQCLLDCVVAECGPIAHIRLVPAPAALAVELSAMGLWSVLK